MTQGTTLNQCPQAGSAFPDGVRYWQVLIVMMTTASSDTTIHPAFTSRTSQALVFDAALRHSLYVLRKRRKGGVKTLGRFGETPDGAESKRVRCSKSGQASKPSLPEPKFALNYLCAGYR